MRIFDEEPRRVTLTLNNRIVNKLNEMSKKYKMSRSYLARKTLGDYIYLLNPPDEVFKSDGIDKIK